MKLQSLALLVALCSTGCIGNIRDTTTPRTATEILLVSTAAERAVRKYDAAPLAGKKVFVDWGLFDSVDKNYVVSAVRNHLARAGVTLAADKDSCDAVMEPRNATLGIWDGDFVLGIPQLPIGAQGLPTVLLPPLYAFRRLSSQGYAKFQLWLYDPATKAYIAQSPDLWGHSFYNQWWILGIGPFDGSNDIYPDMEFGSYLPGSDEQEGD